jgi:hypothetical protein
MVKALGSIGATLDNIGFEVIAHAVEDWQTGGGRTVWLTRATKVGL